MVRSVRETTSESFVFQWCHLTDFTKLVLWLVVWLPFGLFSQKYWDAVIIPIDELFHLFQRGG